uniref:CUB domain-containing protein n=1 Tax=Arion vulgaris TaxID=1028688 RepID=A0A0B7B1G7_9EUPU
MAGLSTLTILFAVVLFCSARVAKRQASAITLDICTAGSLDVAAGSVLHIRSSNFGYSNYNHNTDCITSLKTGQQPLILSVKFLSANIEYNNYCFYDYLCMNGVRYCGNWAAPRTFSFLVPETSTFSLSFHTDISVNGPGFKVRIEARAAESEILSQAVGGVGASASSIAYDRVTYNSYLRSTYYDRCTVFPNMFYNWYTSTTNPSTTT